LRPARAAALRALARRLGARLTVIEGDGRSVALPGPFDAALVDPPCTGLGVLSARPDARWRRSEGDIPGLLRLQGELLARAMGAVRPGGRVVYSTCTLLPEENEGIVAGVAGACDDLSLRFPEFRHPSLPGALRTLPGRHGTDGFFIARVRVPNGYSSLL
jgi:16S rRNA (cytosine967-C5)-methyltransferase